MVNSKARKITMAVLAPAMAKNWMPSNETIGDVQFGYEITSSSGGSTSTRTTS